MASQEQPQTVCSKCGTVLDEPTNTPPMDRSPCPKCGSTNRNFRISITATVSAASSATATLSNAESSATQTISPGTARSLVTAFEPTIGVDGDPGISIEDLPSEVFAEVIRISINLLPDPNDPSGQLIADIGLSGAEVPLGIGNPNDMLVAIKLWLEGLLARYYETRESDGE